MQIQTTLYHLLSSLGAIFFAEKLEEDVRESVFSFDFAGTTYGIFLPQMIFWHQLAFVSISQSVIYMLRFIQPGSISLHWQLGIMVAIARSNLTPLKY